ncbi:hypothetical protein ACFL5O_03185 [Myxococcota bacterium]
MAQDALTPNDFPSLKALAERLFQFERYYESIPKLFEWKFTRADLQARLDERQTGSAFAHAAGGPRRGPRSRVHVSEHETRDWR